MNAKRIFWYANVGFILTTLSKGEPPFAGMQVRRLFCVKKRKRGFCGLVFLSVVRMPACIKMTAQRARETASQPSLCQSGLFDQSTLPR